MRFLNRISIQLLICTLFFSGVAMAQTTVTIGTGTSSSATRGPLQRSDTNSSSVYSRNVLIYTAAELASVGIPNGATIQSFSWDRSNSNTIIGSGNANVKIYLKNSSATAASEDTWANLIAGSTLSYDEDFNTTNNFPSSSGWVQFTLDSPFTYTGGALEIAVDWDCSAVSSPVFSGNGSMNWRYSNTSPDTLLVQRVGSSSAPTNINVKKDQRANIQIEYTAISCSAPTALFTDTTTDTSAVISWFSSIYANDYNWKVVVSGAGVSAPALDSGTTTNTVDSAFNLSPLTSYDLYVESDCGTIGMSGFAGPYTFMTKPLTSVATTIGTGTSSSSTRGPFQRSDTNSSTVYSRFVHIYSATELAAQGITTGTTLTALNWELASSNIIIGAGDASLKVYVKNSSATSATSDSWANLTSGSDLLVDRNFNTTNNFPGANGWMAFDFNAPFVYTGGAIEIAVDWDCSQVSTPAFSGDGSLKWRWTSTAPDDLVVKKTSSSSPSTNITDLKDERANIQIVYALTACEMASGLLADNIGQTSADFHWNAGLGSMSFDWKVVAAGAGATAMAIDSGTTTDTTSSTMLLSAGTSYDLYVEADCGGVGTSGFAGPFNFNTLCANVPATTISTQVTDVSCAGESNGAIDLTVTAGIAPYTFLWSNSETTEDLTSIPGGQYNMTITDANGCPYFDSVSVAEPDMIEITGTTMPDTDSTGVGSVAVTAIGGTQPYSYLWNGVGGGSDSTAIAAGEYLVEVIDANGCSDTITLIVENLVGLTNIEILTSLKIYPNPSNGILNVDIHLSEVSEVELRIYSITGKMVFSEQVGGVKEVNRNLDLSSLKEGLYFARILVDAQSITKRIILIK